MIHTFIQQRQKFFYEYDLSDRWQHQLRVEAITYPDQPSWSNQVVAKLIQGKSLSSLLPGLGKSLSNNAKAAGYKVVTK